MSDLADYPETLTDDQRVAYISAGLIWAKGRAGGVAIPPSWLAPFWVGPSLRLTLTDWIGT